MFNFVHSRLCRPERGWDPVCADKAQHYAQFEWQQTAEKDAVVSKIEARLGGLAGKRVLDLGGGPGQYSVAFAAKGALVHWHDVSRTYMQLARQKATEHKVSVDFSLGYLEEIEVHTQQAFDLVFSRLTWLYCMDDRRFAALIFGLLKKGGYAFLWSNTRSFERSLKRKISLLRRARYALYQHLGVKIGHLHPERGAIAALFNQLHPEYLEADYSQSDADVILVRR